MLFSFEATLQVNVSEREGLFTDHSVSIIKHVWTSMLSQISSPLLLMEVSAPLHA